MQSNAFLRTVRTYAALSQRKHVSYGDAVNALLSARLTRIKESDLTPEQREAQAQDAIDFVDREYAAVDPDFVLTADIPF